MKLVTRAVVALGLLLALGTAASAAEVKIRLMDAETALVGQHVVIYTSVGRQEAVTDANGLVTFDVGPGAGMWVQVNGQRLRTFYRQGQTPVTIDPEVVGFMPWNGGSQP